MPARVHGVGVGRAAFTLIELLTALFIIGIVSGACSVAFGRLGAYTTAKLEAERAVRWLYFVMERAENSAGNPLSGGGRSFSICVENGGLAVFMRPAAGMGNAGGSDSERLRSSEGFAFRSLGGSARTVYSPQWGTFTPAMTIEVSRTDKRNKSRKDDDRQYIIFSGQGMIRISDSAPTD